MFSLVFVATDTAKELNSYLTGIDRIENPSLQHQWTLVQEHLSSHSALSSYLLLHCSLFGDSPSFYNLWSRPWEFPSFWDSMVFHHAPIPQKGTGSNNNNIKLWACQCDTASSIHTQALLCCAPGKRSLWQFFLIGCRFVAEMYSANSAGKSKAGLKAA